MRKKILFYIDSFMLGGEQKIALDYLKLLQKEYELALLVNQDLGEDNFFLSEIPEEIPLRFVVGEETMRRLEHYKKTRKKSLWSRLLYSYYLSRKRKERLHKIATLLAESSYDICLDFSNKLPENCIDARTFIWHHTSLGKLSKKEKAARKRRYEKAKKIVVVSKNMQEEFRQAFPEIQEKIVVMPNFIDLESIQALAEEEIAERGDFFLCCSRLDPKKDIETSIRAFHLWKREETHQEKLLILGEGEEREKLQTLVQNLGLEGEVLLLGRRENPYAYMKRAKLFLHSSLEEGFGLVLVEAMACGTPVIATDCPVGPREILQGGEVGFLVPLKHSEKIYEHIKRLHENEEEYRNIQRKAYTRAQDFDQQKVFSRLVGLWD